MYLFSVKFITYSPPIYSTNWYLFSNYKNPNIANQNKIAQTQSSLVYHLKTT